VEPIASALQKVVARAVEGANDGPLLAWPLACGSAVAERTRALEFRGGVLWVQVPDKDWRTELQDLAPRYLAAINKYSASPIEKIEFVVAERPRKT
jgi:predicted nucleic acid-binding Zn ribbon protein